MTITEPLLPEFDREMASTRKILERVPTDKLGWKPHEKSMTLGKLANHVASIPVLAAFVISGQGGKPVETGLLAEVLAAFDQNVASARAASPVRPTLTGQAPSTLIPCSPRHE